MPRPRFSVYIATSLDGYIARTDGALDWLTIVERAGEDYGYQRFFDTVDTLVIGRKTYDTVLGFGTWSYTGKRCVVVTHAPPAARHGEEFFAGDLSALADRLGAEGAKHVYVDGGSILSQCLAQGLVDALTVSIVPVLLGGGIPLTQALGGDVRLRLTRTQSFDSGLVQLAYDVVRSAA